MGVVEIRTDYGWINNKMTVTERKIEHFEKGNDVYTTVQRSYSVPLYESDGRLQEYPSKGSNLDINV